MSSEEDADVAKFGRVGAMFGSVINGALIEDEEAADPVGKLIGTFVGMGVGAAYNSYKKNQKEEMQVINSSEWCQANWCTIISTSSSYKYIQGNSSTCSLSCTNWDRLSGKQSKTRLFPLPPFTSLCISSATSSSSDLPAPHTLLPRSIHSLV